MISAQIQKLKFIHIDDFDNYRSMLKAILKSMGIENIDEASNALSALEKIKKTQYDVILCDYNLGEGQDGQQLLEELMFRKLLPYGTIYMMVTAENTMDMVMAAIEYRPDSYLNKPIPKELLISRLEKLMEKKETFKDIYLAYNKKDYPLALKICDKKMADHRKYALDIGKLKGEIALVCGEIEMAEAIYDKALSIRDFEWALLGKAKSLFQKEDYTQAKECLQKLIETNPKYVEAYDLLAKIYELEEDLYESQKTLELAAKLSPRTVIRQQRISQVALKNNDHEAAEKALRSSIRHGKFSYSGKVDDHTQLAKLYMEKGQVSKATKVLSNAKKEYKKDKDSIFHTSLIEGKAEFKRGKEDKAREIFTQAIHNMPQHIADLSVDIQADLIASSEELGESEITTALKSDIENGTNQQGRRTSSVEKYAFLLMNGKAMRFYNEEKWFDAMELFKEAASNLPDNISINMNAAQTIMLLLKRKLIKDNKTAKQMRQQAREFLDVSCSLDNNNEKYLKLEKVYADL